MGGAMNKGSEWLATYWLAFNSALDNGGDWSREQRGKLKEKGGLQYKRI